MIAAEFTYLAPRSLDEALELYERHGVEAKLLAGGHSLIPLMKFRLAAPRYLIDLARVADLAYIREEDGQISIGAMTTHSEIEHSALLREKCPLLAAAAAEIGDVQVRNRGTIGGSLAHADPAADYPAAILALDAELRIAARSGERTISPGQFFVDMLTTDLQPGDILTEVRVPVNARRTGSAYLKLRQPASGFAIVGVAARVTLDEKGNCVDARVGVTGVASKAYRAAQVESVLRGWKPTAKRLAEAAAGAVEGVEPLADLHASADYRAEMAHGYTRRALELAFERAGWEKAAKAPIRAAARPRPSRGKKR